MDMDKAKLFDYRLVGKRNGEDEWCKIARITAPVETVSQALELEGSDRDKWLSEYREFEVQARDGNPGWVVVSSMTQIGRGWVQK